MSRRESRLLRFCDCADDFISNGLVVKDLFLLAPLHNPMNFLGIQLMEKRFPNLQQVS